VPRIEAIEIAILIGLSACASAPPPTVTSCPDHKTSRGGIAITFDDRHTDDWARLIPYFDAHDVHATFYVSRTGTLDDAGWADLAALAAHGHEIAAHSEHHVSASDYCGSTDGCTSTRVARYFADEIDDQLADFAAHDVTPVDFAYPFGATNATLADALGRDFRTVRGIAGVDPGGDIVNAEAAYVADGARPHLIEGIPLDRSDLGDADFVLMLERAYCRDETVITYGHDPLEAAAPDVEGVTLLSRIRQLVDGAERLGLSLRRVDELGAHVD
jgi:peptidoglycan/xylan/chitin deacetylase (PgdA/CDA1 family)